MKPNNPTTRALAWLTIATLSAGSALAQDNNPPAPPPPNGPPPAPAMGAPGMHPDIPHPGGPGQPMMFPPPGMHPPHQERTTFLGVGVGPVPPPVADQLNLPEGFGLLVEFVMPGSAADAAGIKQNDVLKTLDDQKLVNPEQLSALVRADGDGKDVSLEIIHKGQESKVSLKLKKQDLPAHGPWMKGHGPGPGGEDADDDEDRPDHPGRRMYDFHHPEGEEHGGPLGENTMGDNPPAPPGAPLPPVRDIIRALRPEIQQAGKALEDARREITILREGDGSARQTRLDLEKARIVVRDDKGELELKSDDGKRFLTAKDAQGKQVFSGPVNTPDDLKKVPADILPRLQKLEHDELPAFPEAPDNTQASITQPNAPKWAMEF